MAPRKTTKKTTTATQAKIEEEIPLTSPKVRRARTTRSKADVQAAFIEVAGEAANKEDIDPKFVEVMKAKEDRIRKSVAGLTVEGTISSLSTVGLDISRGLNQVSEVLTKKLQELQDVSEAVEIQRNELANLHKIDVAVTAIDNLVTDYANQQAELEAEIADRKALWARDEAEHARFIRERNEEAEKVRRRESADYEYNKAQERKFAQAAFEEELEKLDKAAKEKNEMLEKQWAIREEALKAREAELVELREQVAAMPEKMKKEIAKAEAIVTNTLNRNHQTEMTLLKKDMDTTAQLANQEIVALKGALQKQAEQMHSLQEQLNAEKTVSQNVVLKALDSASDQRALREITQFASGRDGSASAKK